MYVPCKLIQDRDPVSASLKLNLPMFLPLAYLQHNVS